MKNEPSSRNYRYFGLQRHTCESSSTKLCTTVKILRHRDIVLERRQVVYLPPPLKNHQLNLVHLRSASAEGTVVLLLCNSWCNYFLSGGNSTPCKMATELISVQFSCGWMDVQCGTINSRRVAGARVKYTPQVLRITDVSLKVEIPPKIL